jgi:hypothetical protein
MLTSPVGSLVRVVFAAGLSTSIALEREHNQSNSAEMTFDEVLVASEGTVVQAGEMLIDPSLHGSMCEVSVDMENQISVHPGTDLILTVGGSQVVITDVEGAGNSAATTAHSVVAGETLRADVRIGSDGVSSMGFRVRMTCDSGAAPVLVLGEAAQSSPLPEATPATPVLYGPDYAG